MCGPDRGNSRLINVEAPADTRLRRIFRPPPSSSRPTPDAASPPRRRGTGNIVENARSFAGTHPNHNSWPRQLTAVPRPRGTERGALDLPPYLPHPPHLPPSPPRSLPSSPSRAGHSTGPHISSFHRVPTTLKAAPFLSHRGPDPPCLPLPPSLPPASVPQPR